MAHMVPILEARGSEGMSHVVNLWGKLQSKLSNYGFLGQAKKSVSAAQLAGLRVIWGVDPKADEVWFYKRILVIKGQDLEPCLSNLDSKC